ncbi:hypothetical protein IE81DRAFT_326545, partial [Ceraceosorus guamensis]
MMQYSAKMMRNSAKGLAGGFKNYPFLMTATFLPFGIFLGCGAFDCDFKHGKPDPALSPLPAPPPTPAQVKHLRHARRSELSTAVIGEIVRRSVEAGPSNGDVVHNLPKADVTRTAKAVKAGKSAARPFVTVAKAIHAYWKKHPIFGTAAPIAATFLMACELAGCDLKHTDTPPRKQNHTEHHVRRDTEGRTAALYDRTDSDGTPPNTLFGRDVDVPLGQRHFLSTVPGHYEPMV